MRGCSRSLFGMFENVMGAFQILVPLNFLLIGRWNR